LYIRGSTPIKIYPHADFGLCGPDFGRATGRRAGFDAAPASARDERNAFFS
jgi:hypothetical protein